MMDFQKFYAGEEFGDQKLIDAYDMALKDALNKDFILDDMMASGWFRKRTARSTRLLQGAEKGVE